MLQRSTRSIIDPHAEVQLALVSFRDRLGTRGWLCYLDNNGRMMAEFAPSRMSCHVRSSVRNSRAQLLLDMLDKNAIIQVVQTDGSLHLFGDSELCWTTTLPRLPLMDDKSYGRNNGCFMLIWFRRGLVSGEDRNFLQWATALTSNNPTNGLRPSAHYVSYAVSHRKH